MPAKTHTHSIEHARAVLDAVRDHVADALDIPVDEVTEFTLLPSDGLAVAAIIRDLKEEFGERSFGIAGDDVADWTTVADVVEHVSNERNDGDSDR